MKQFLGALAGLLVAGLALPAAMGQWNSPNPVVSFDKLPNGLAVHQKDGLLRLEVDAADVIHVTYAPLGPAAPDRPSDGVVIKKDWAAAPFDIASNDRAITLSTAKLRVVVERESGALHYIVPEGATSAGATGPGSTGGGM